MKTFKQKAVFSAVASASLLLAANAGAVNLNPDGLGEVLIYPYYTVRNGTTTLISVVNTTNNAKAVKVRFLEGKNSAEVLDFNLFLSAKDVWTAAIVDNGTGAGIATADKSCTNPTITGVVAFRNAAYASGASADRPELRGLDRTREGYLEMIEMATIIPDSDTEADVTHDGGVPACELVSNSKVSANSGDYVSPTGGLFGAGTFISSSGMSTGYNATAVQGCGYFGGVTPSGNLLPNLASCDNAVAVVVDSPASGTTRITAADFSANIDPLGAMSALFMHSKVMGEYAYTADKVLSTDWVVTMPTKRDYVNNGTLVARRPFQRVWDGAFVDVTGAYVGLGRACDDVSLNSYDREEGTSTTNDDFSPSTSSTPRLCWEANVIGFGGLVSGASRILGSTNAVGYNAYQAGDTLGKEGGWAELTFRSGALLVSDTSSQQTLISGASIGSGVTGTVTFQGLPTLGFATNEAKYNAGNPANNFLKAIPRPSNSLFPARKTFFNRKESSHDCANPLPTSRIT